MYRSMEVKLVGDCGDVLRAVTAGSIYLCLTSLSCLEKVVSTVTYYYQLLVEVTNIRIL
jgi:hypothetical protein